jgi:hypothetical protein
MTTQPTKPQLIQQLNRETSKMPWSELQKFFANGSAVFVDASLDLIHVAADIALDNTAQLSPLMQQGKVQVVDIARAEQWAAEDAILWAVVVAPWLLVQPIQNTIQ